MSEEESTEEVEYDIQSDLEGAITRGLESQLDMPEGEMVLVTDYILITAYTTTQGGQYISHLKSENTPLWITLGMLDFVKFWLRDKTDNVLYDVEEWYEDDE